jgi:hypothetical protein
VIPIYPIEKKSGACWRYLRLSRRTWTSNPMGWETIS